MREKEAKTKVDELKEALQKKKRSHKDSAEKEIKDIDLDKITSQIEFAEKEAKEHYDKLLRVTAELDNYKKRSQREKSELVKYGNENIITDLLPVLDDMDRVLDHLPEGASKELLDFVAGVQLVAKQLRGVLRKYGLEEIPAEDEKFNPEIHEAVAHIPSEVEEDHVVEVHRKGYFLNKKVIRAAMVTVSKGPEK